MGVTARQQRVGIKKGVTWGTAVAVGAGAGYYLRDDYRDEPATNPSIHESAGQNFITEVVSATTKPIVAVLPMHLHYNDTWQNLLWALVLGGAGGVPTLVGSTLAYSNFFEPGVGGGFTGKMCTIVRDKAQKIVEIASAKLDGFVLKVGTNGRLEIDWSFIGQLGSETSAVNTTTQMNALTYYPDGLRAFFHQLVCRINVASGAALASGDAFNITGLTLTYKQPFDQRFVGGAVGIIEPEDNGKPTVELQLTFARFDAASKVFSGWQLAQTALKADITITGALIETTFYNTLTFSLPSLRVRQNAEPLPGAGTQAAPTVTLDGYAALAAPAGMVGITKPIRVATIGTQSVNPLA